MNTNSFLSKYEPYIYSVLRIVAGFLYLWHGSQKLFDFPHLGHPMPPYIIYIAGPIEFFGGLLIMTGLWTRWVAFICSGEMAYAYWTVHAWHAALPLVNGGELAIIYCFLFLYFITRGSGVVSIDHLFKKKG